METQEILFNFKSYCKNLSHLLKGQTVLRDWEGLLMVEIDNSYLFTDARARLFLNLSTFS